MENKKTKLYVRLCLQFEGRPRIETALFHLKGHPPKEGAFKICFYYTSMMIGKIIGRRFVFSKR